MDIKGVLRFIHVNHHQLVKRLKSYHLHTPFHTLFGSTAKALRTIVNVEIPQKAGSSWVRNCSARRKYTSSDPFCEWNIRLLKSVSIKYFSFWYIILPQGPLKKVFFLLRKKKILLEVMEALGDKTWFVIWMPFKQKQSTRRRYTLIVI